MAPAFNGSSDYLTKAAALFSGSAGDYNFSLFAWVRPDDRHEGVIIGADDGSTNAERFSLFSRANGRFALRRKGGYIQTATLLGFM